MVLDPDRITTVADRVRKITTMKKGNPSTGLVSPIKANFPS
jgi:hypothetical protein